MEKRAFERQLSNINVRFLSDKTEYLGTVKNISKKGMFISTQVNFPLELQLEILIPLKEELLKLPAKIIKIKKSGDNYSGISVELLSPSQTYLEFVDSLKPVIR